jgi:PilZ domain
VRVTINHSCDVIVEFESGEELQAEYDNNLSAGGLCFPAEARLPEFSSINLTLKLSGRGEIVVPATVVRQMDGALAVAMEESPEKIFAALTAGSATEEAPPQRKEQNAWDRVRDLSRTEKLLLAPKADRSERAVLIQENDAQVLYSLLKNPRITTDEVARIARSSLLSSVTADLISKTTQWSGSQEIRAALVHNPRTPTPLALRLLPTLPESEIRQIAKATAVSQALRQAALKLVIYRK